MNFKHSAEILSAIDVIFSRYRAISSSNRAALSSLPPECSADSLIQLCDEAILHSNQYPFDKLCRWMGFAQGVLCTIRAIDVETERNFTRPILHAIHIDPIPSFSIREL